jgi:hypothetical protein
MLDFSKSFLIALAIIVGYVGFMFVGVASYFAYQYNIAQSPAFAVFLAMVPFVGVLAYSFLILHVFNPYK